MHHRKESQAIYTSTNTVVIVVMSMYYVHVVTNTQGIATVAYSFLFLPNLTMVYSNYSLRTLGETVLPHLRAA